MSYTDLVQIYDADDGLMRWSGKNRGNAELVGVTGGIEGLKRVLDRFVSEKRVFGRAVFHTHGNKGYIAFGHVKGNVALTATVLSKEFAGRQYEKLFTYNARIYFNGCNVAGGNEGWGFLEAAGSTFLGWLGGTTFAHTSKGYPITFDVLSVFAGVATDIAMWSKRGHSPHFSGDTRYVYTAPGRTGVRKWSE